MVQLFVQNIWKLYFLLLSYQDMNANLYFSRWFVETLNLTFLDPYICFVCLFNRLIFRAVLGSQQSWEESIDIFHNLPPTHMHSLPIINIPHPNGAFITTDEPTLINHYHPEFIVYLWLTLGSVHAISVEKCIITETYSVIQSICTTLKVLSALFIVLSLR